MKIYQSCRWQASLRGFLLVLGALALVLAHVPFARAQIPFVPTPPEVVERMLALAQLGPGDYLIDLGSGDGRLVREAARRYGTRGLGVEIDPQLVARSRELARRDGVEEKASFLVQDLFQTELSEASVVTMYLLPAVTREPRPRLLAQLKPGSRIVSHDFDLGDWPADATEKVHAKEKYGASPGESTVYLWIVPAQLGGRWTWELELAGQRLRYELRALQRFQQVDATLRVEGREQPVRDFRVRGDRVEFTVTTEVKGSSVQQRFSGRASGDSLQGSVISSGPRLQGASDFAAQREALRSSAEPRPAAVLSAQPPAAALASADPAGAARARR